MKSIWFFAIGIQSVLAFTPFHVACRRLSSKHDVGLEYKVGPEQEESQIGHEPLETLFQSRPYPLFLAEKVAEFLEPRAFHSEKNYAAVDLISATDKPAKERIVVLGTGWGATAFLKNIDTELFDVTVVSPRNFFLFTPMLAGASVGSLEYRSIMEPIREINPRVVYLEGSAMYVDPVEKTVVVNPVNCESNNCDIFGYEELPYDRLVYTVGAKTNTFGIPGVHEHCNILKSVEDARKIRAAVVNCFERASYPGLEESEKMKMLSFCIIGGGPSGIEFAAELKDFVEQDANSHYPDLLQYVRINVIEGSKTILSPFHESLRNDALVKLKRNSPLQDPTIPVVRLMDIMLETMVKEVTKESIVLHDGRSIAYGLSVWAAGNAPLSLTQDLIKELGAEQEYHQTSARGRIAVDLWMRANGSSGTIFAIGDASCVVSNPLPSTGQVAAQEGEYLASLLNKQFNLNDFDETSQQLLPPSYMANITRDDLLSDFIAGLSTKQHHVYAKPFQFLDLGIMAYTGRNTALAQVATAPNMEPLKVSGRLGNEMWRGVYLWKQISWRNRIMVVCDWLKRSIFGRDISHLE